MLVFSGVILVIQVQFSPIGIVKPQRQNRSITVQRKYARRKKNLNTGLIKLRYLCHRTVIYLTLLILLSSYLKAILTTIEMKRQMTKRKLSELDYLILDK